MNEASDNFDESVVEVVVDEVRANVLESSASRFVNVMALHLSLVPLTPDSIMTSIVELLNFILQLLTNLQNN